MSSRVIIDQGKKIHDSYNIKSNQSVCRGGGMVLHTPGKRGVETNDEACLNAGSDGSVKSKERKVRERVRL